MNVGGIVFRDDIAARHAVAAVVAGGPASLASRQRCLADVNYLNAQAGRAALDDPVRAAHRHGRQKDTVGEIFQVICISANTDLSLDLVVVGRKIGVIQRPIFSRPFECVALEIPVAQPPGYGVPEERFPADTARPLVFESRDTRHHHRHFPILEIERHGVGRKGGARIDLGPTLDDDHVETARGQPRGQDTARRSRSHDAHVKDRLVDIDLRHSIHPNGSGNRSTSEPRSPRCYKRNGWHGRGSAPLRPDEVPPHPFLPRVG